jgi:hypothetical protein
MGIHTKIYGADVWIQGCEKGHEAILGSVLVMALKVDFPAFGSPTRPISAIDFNSNSKSFLLTPYATSSRRSNMR